MDTYKAREYLSRLTDVYNDIERNMMRINELRLTIDGTGGSNSSGDRVKSSTRGDRIESMVGKLIELEEKTNILIMKYDSMRKKRVIRINEVGGRESEVLKAFYIYRKSNKEISSMLNISESTVHRLHKNGLKQFAEKFF